MDCLIETTIIPDHFKLFYGQILLYDEEFKKIWRSVHKSFMNTLFAKELIKYLALCKF